MIQKKKKSSRTQKKRSPLRIRRSKQVLGWREWISLPLLNIKKIKVKVDTGARTSSLHAYDVETFRRGGKEFVRFKVHPVQKNDRKILECESELKEWRNVTDSGGKRTLRPVIETVLELGRIPVFVEVTLTSRDEMGFRMLLGRQALKGVWIVDPARSYLAGKKNSKKNQSFSSLFEEE